MKYWLMKSEPDVFSIDDLKTKKQSGWDGVRNYQARNFMRDEMKLGDYILFYHSSCEVPGVAGLGRVCKESHPDPTQFDPKSDYYDEKATKENPRWFMVAVEYVEKSKSYLPLSELKNIKGLEKLPLLQKGSRLSINPVSKEEFQIITSRIGIDV
ncbi:MAG: EVE domain-containing protein [Bacteriovoracaceae bacterium]|jgi:predicted RNA-binding protein with PUA-like domain|nr:EVE domain-containing protein [Bacteriovoracaceae bacterium]